MHMDVVVVKLFSNTVRSIHFRCCQFLHWPIFLQDRNVRDHLYVELAEKAVFRRHSVWSNLLVDLLLGNLFGIALWVMSEPVCLSVSNFAHDFTKNWLRAGCVCLMGNPAGFKFNAELASVLVIISLNRIQIWSTLWAFLSFLIVPLTKGLALCGILFGLTSAAALVLDAISLVTMRVMTLHLALSLMDSIQIKAVAGLWRLFRGQKWNPLRLRLDSYDYTVEQHIVGSLLFTPILLLLPTTSAFYIFFTIFLHISYLYQRNCGGHHICYPFHALCKNVPLVEEETDFHLVYGLKSYQVNIPIIVLVHAAVTPMGGFRKQLLIAAAAVSPLFWLRFFAATS